MLTKQNDYTVIAVPWEHGWDLYLDEDNVTSVEDLNDATQQVRDYLDTIEPERDHSRVGVSVRVESEAQLNNYIVNVDGARQAVRYRYL